VAYIDDIMKAETQPNYVDNGVDPYLLIILAPTEQMLKKLVWPKFRAFARPFEADFNKSENRLLWKKKNSVIYGISSEKIQRMEGLKVNHIHMTEVFQMSEYAFLESLARTADTKGTITLDGSLGPQIINPKTTWPYRRFKQKIFPDTQIWEWGTKDNPYFPQDELIRLKDTLDPTTFKAMFDIEWDTSPTSAVYEEFNDQNVMQHYAYNPNLPTYVSVDFGWVHAMAATFWQWDKRTDTIYLFDEIIKSKITIDELHNLIMAKPYNYTDFCCDIAGNQEREQTGISNVQWFRTKGIHFKFRSTAILYGIPILRSYIKDGKGRRRLFVSAQCVKSIDGFRQYRYAEKDGMIVNENPIKVDDDAVDSARYFAVNFLDKSREGRQSSVTSFER
jgi:hypothetical protein